MFCDGCGNALQPAQQFCSKCGKQIVGPSVIGYPRRSRVREHLRLLGILWLALGAWELTGGAVLYVVANAVLRLRLPNGGPPPEARLFLSPLLSFIALLLILKAVAGFATGWGLLQRAPWARVLSLVLAFLALFHVPFGTALGIYTLWVLLPFQSDEEYQEQARSADAA